MSAGEIHQGDTGTIFEFTVKEGDEALDLSEATGVALKLKKPGGAVVSVMPTFKTDGTDGIIRWITADAGDLDECGIWQAQVVATWASGSWHSDLVEFRVYGNLEGEE